MNIDLYPAIAARIGDPGAYVDRLLTPSGEPMESVPRWAARAVTDHVQPMIEGLLAELGKVRDQLTAANHHADGLAADYRSIGRGALIGYRDENHRHNDRAPGWCICGDDWDDEGCTEYVGLTEAAQLFPAEVAR